MRARTLAILGLTFCGAGCFAEPETVEEISSGGTSTGATSLATSGSSGDTGSSGSADTGSSSDDEATLGGADSTGGDLDCTFQRSNPPEFEADVVILVDPDVALDWAAIEVGIAAARLEGAHVAILLTTAQSAQIADPNCISCGGAGCNTDVPLLKIVYQAPSALQAITQTDVSCFFHDTALAPTTRHYWLFTDALAQVVPDEFEALVASEGARFHASSSMEIGGRNDGDIAELVKGTLGSRGAYDDNDELAEQFRFVGSPRLACTWPVDPEPGALPFFGLINNFIFGTLGEEGVLGSPVLSASACDDDAPQEPTLDEIPFEFFYDKILSQDVAVACPIACAFIQLEPADDTDLVDVYCEPA